MFNLAVVFLCILLCCAESVKADDDYSTEVETLFKNLTSDYKNFVTHARQKMNSFANETLDRRYAIGIINLYTSAGNFNRDLNDEMRQGYPKNNTDIWRRAGNLINRGLDILGPTVHEKVYRGCTKGNQMPVAGREYSFNHITSTSTNKTIAFNFISCKEGIFFVIDNVYGVSVEKYSALSDEKEVIIKSTNVFKVKSGPINETKHNKMYSIFNLDGQPDVQCRKKRDTSHQSCVIKKQDASGVNKPGAENITMYTFFVVTILILYELI